VHIGNFVEVKNSTLAAGAKANHLAYLGDATVGERVNYGAGSITANYDGANKHRTVIEADVHVGSNCVLVAPVTIGAGGTIGGGSTVNKSTEPGALTVARGKQVSFPELEAAAEEAQGLTAVFERGASGPAAPRVELARLRLKNGLHVAHVGIGGEQALRQRAVVRHVARAHHQHEVGAGRDAPALLHRVVGDHAGLEGVERGGVLPVQRDLDHRLQSVAEHRGQPVGRGSATWRSMRPSPSAAAPAAGRWAARCPLRRRGAGWSARRRAAARRAARSIASREIDSIYR
jgi:hypothetical protein